MKRDPEAELVALALRLASVRDPRTLAFEVVALLLSVLRQTVPSLRYADALSRLIPLFDAATDAVAAPVSTRAEQMADVRVTADRAASSFFARCHDRGTWPLELPYAIATAIRRTCEPDMARMLPLIVRDARALLTHAMAGPERIDALLAAAGATTPNTGDATT